MDYSMAVAAIFGLAPAVVLMYFVLKKYTYPAVERPFFSDPTLFGLFAVGLVVGTVMYVVYTYFGGATIITAIAFALIYELIKMIILNMKRFQGKSDTVFYGYGLGLGMGATLAFGMVFYISQAGMDTASWVILAVMSITTVLLHSATGTTIGEGVTRNRPWEFFFQALLVDMIVQLIMVPVYTIDVGSSVSWLSYVALGSALLVTIVYFYRMHFIKLPEIVRYVLRSEKKKKTVE